MKKESFFAPLLIMSAILLPLKTSAFCPLCVAATGGIAIVSRWLGINDIIIGLWIGAFILSLSFLTYKYLAQWNVKIKKLPFGLTLIMLIFYGSAIMGFIATNFINPYAEIWGINRMFWGIAIGSISFMAVPKINELLKKINKGKSFFPYQKIVVAISMVAVLSLIFYILIK